MRARVICGCGFALLSILLAGCGEEVGAMFSKPTSAQVVNAQMPADDEAQPRTRPRINRGRAFVRALREPSLAETASDSLSRIGEAALPQLVAALADPDPQVRRLAADAMAKMGPEASPAVQALLQVLEGDAHIDVRRAAARALGQIGPAAEPAVPALIRALSVPEPGRGLVP